MSDNSIQNIVNRMSLVMTIPEDIVKACKQAEFPPAMVETLLRLHNQQVELEKALNTLRSNQLQMARIIERQADMAGIFSKALGEMAEHTGYNANEVVSSEEIGQE